MTLEVKVASSDARLVSGVYHNVVLKCSRRMLQSALVVLLKAFLRTDYKAGKTTHESSQKGGLCLLQRKDAVDKNPRPEET